MALIFENKVPQSYRIDFIAKLKTVATNLGIDPNWLMAVINWESAGSFSADKTNSIGATGLIQFMPKTAIGLGTTTAQLRQMTAVQQLDFVYKYYYSYRKYLKSYGDLYLATIFPLSLGKTDDWVIKGGGISAQTFAKHNPAFDKDGNGIVTVADIKKVMLYKTGIPKDWLDYFNTKKP
jgi:hypothetical protein